MGHGASERRLRAGTSGGSQGERFEIARKFIGEVGLAGFESSYPHQLSGGMRQRVGLARALTVDADIILMDEPFSSVDEQTRRKFQEDLLDLLRHRQKTVIFVTHSIEEAAYLSDRIVLLSAGRERFRRSSNRMWIGAARALTRSVATRTTWMPWMRSGKS